MERKIQNYSSLYFRIFESMGKRTLNILLGLLVFSSVVPAQILKPVPISYLNQKQYSPQPIVFEKNPIPFDNLKFSITNNLKCTLPKGAIFCRMEDAIYNHLNFWVKFRMGTDDRYSN
ncbi:MAG TPA: hypothetical protein VK809_10690 [Bacteroidia bacterium]|jgi:hypothetical protein|nr:hypothetical protein [Bacteroidia bacterium]